MSDQFVLNNVYQGSTQVCASYLDVVRPRGQGSNLDLEIQTTETDMDAFSNEIDMEILSDEETI